MPPEINQNVTSSVQSSQHVLLWGVGVAFVLLASGAYYYALQVVRTPSPSADIEPTELIVSKRAGDLETALQEVEKITNDPLRSPDEQALAVFNSGKIRFKLSGNIQELLVDIQNLKTIILDDNVEQWIRVRALNALATSYCSSGRDPLAFEEIYKDEPFRQYLAPGDPDLSARYLAEWSYQMRPSAYAAVRIARWHADRLVGIPMTVEQRKEHAETVREYLRIAETLIEDEIAKYPDYLESTEYAGYLFWRAREYGQLARYGDRWYQERYKQAFADVIEYVERQGNIESMDDLYFSYQYLAQFSAQIERNTETAKVALDTLAAKLNAIKNPVVVTFVRWIRNEYQNNPEGGSWQGILWMTTVSPSYKEVVEKFLMLSPSVMRPEGLGEFVPRARVRPAN